MDKYISKKNVMTYPRVSFIVPSTNIAVETVLEIIQSKNKFMDVNITRVEVTEISHSQANVRQFSTQSFTNPAKFAAAVKPDLIVWAGTSGSWLGYDYEELLLNHIENTTGIKAIGCYTEICKACEENSIRNIGLLTPYDIDIHSRIKDNLKKMGISSGSEKWYGITDNYSFAKIPIDKIVSDMVNLKSATSTALIPMCTNMLTALVSDEIENYTDLTVIDPNIVIIRRIKNIFNISVMLKNFGRILSDYSG